MARKYEESTTTAKPANDAYTGMLGISLGALLIGCVLLYFDYSQYPTTPPPKVDTSYKAPPAVPPAGIAPPMKAPEGQPGEPSPKAEKDAAKDNADKQ